MKQIRSNLKALADDRGLSIRKLAEAIDYRFETVRQLYNDDTKHYPKDLLEKLCDYFGCEVSDILKIE